MNARKLVAGLILVALAVVPMLVIAGDEANVEYKLFNGSTLSLRAGYRSPWVYVGGSNRVIIRTWSSLNVPTSTAWKLAGDSVYTDSLEAISFLFSDSVSFIGRDSSGTLVTARSTTYSWRDSMAGKSRPFPICADSVQINGTTAVVTDTTRIDVTIQGAPLMEPLRPSFNGSGTYTIIAPVLPSQIATNYGAYEAGSITKKYMAVFVRPWKRRVVTGSTDSTQGVKGLRMIATAVYRNK